MERPNSFYKYCPIYDPSKLKDENSLNNLFEKQVVFSTRKNFNDLFDSKIEFIIPNRLQLKSILQFLSSNERKKFKAMFLGEQGKDNLDKIYRDINLKFDSYLFYCLTIDPKNNLMWSHYTNSHKGFCIEWDSKMIPAERVKYRQEIASFHLIDAIKIYFSIGNSDEISKKLWNALKIKLDEWRYENEYRVHLGNNMQHFIKVKKEKFSLVSFDPEWMKSIIFGCRMDETSRKYLMDNLPFKVKWKEAIEAKSTIEIRDIN